MTGYIYHIKCINTDKEYIGITSDIKRRFTKHKSELNANRHHSPKLQNAWNYYGQDAFIFSYRTVEIKAYDDLYQLEIEEIEKYDTYNNGYNCNSGGKIYDWNQKVNNDNVIEFLCFLEKYGDGYGKTFEEKFNWAKGTASRIQRGLGYLDARGKYEQLTSDEKNKIVQELFEEITVLKQKRALNQGGCSKSYQLTLEDYLLAFAAQEIGRSYTETATFLGIKPNTVKDWYGKRSRKKERDAYQKLSDNDKQNYRTLAEKIPQIAKKTTQKYLDKDILGYLCLYQVYGPGYDSIFQQKHSWAEGTAYNIRKKDRYLHIKQKLEALSEKEIQQIAKEYLVKLNTGRTEIAELSGEA